MMTEPKVKIGEFSRITGISAETLRRYCNLGIIEWVNEKFVRLLGIKSQKIYRASETSLTRQGSWSLHYNRQDDVKKILSALYNGATMMLMRKKMKMLQEAA